MIAYTFCINLIVWGYHDYQSIWDNSLADGDLLCVWEMYEEFTQSTGHGYQEDDWWYPASCWVCAKENIFNLFNILKKRWQYYTLMTLYYWCVKIWMVKIWWIFGQLSILPNFFSQRQSFLPYGKIILVALILSALLWVACVIVMYSHACTYTLPRQLFIG